MENEKPIRLQAFLAQCGLGSRRKCEEIIADGRVVVNGNVVEIRGVKIHQGDEVTVDGKQVNVSRKLYFALNKPQGYLCSNRDELSGKPLAIELFKNKVPGRIFHVGRLDFMTSGLIFYSNDGDFTNIMTHPSYGVEKDYVVETLCPIPSGILEKYTNGIKIEGVRYRLKGFKMINPGKVLLTLLEGKNREIRRFFNHFNVGIKIIHRNRIGPVSIKGLESGEFRPLTSGEIDWFLKKVNKI